MIAACKEDVDIRGLNNFISDKIKLISSSDVIDLIFESETINNM
ncbi:MAG: hypothetical protein ACFFA0_02520 [Promethearchaeota archaeon]